MVLGAQWLAVMLVVGLVAPTASGHVVNASSGAPVLTSGPWYQSLREELTDEALPAVRSGTHGFVPWLRGGALIRVGPALFEAGSESFAHWFDGSAMLYGFDFANGSVPRYTNRFVESANLRSHRKADRVGCDEFATSPRVGFLRRVAHVLFRHKYDNPNVNVARYAGRFVAITDMPPGVEFRWPGLATVGSVRYQRPRGGDAVLRAQMSCSHPVRTADGGSVGLATRVGLRNEYVLYKIPGPSSLDGSGRGEPDQAADMPRDGHTPPTRATARGAAGEGTVTQALERRVFARVPTRHPAYLHSFGLSAGHVVLAEFPWHFNLGGMLVDGLRWVLTGRPKRHLEAMFTWRPDRGTLFTAVDRQTGRVAGRWRAPPVFAYHHINAFESRESVVSRSGGMRSPGDVPPGAAAEGGGGGGNRR